MDPSTAIKVLQRAPKELYKAHQGIQSGDAGAHNVERVLRVTEEAMHTVTSATMAGALDDREVRRAAGAIHEFSGLVEHVRHDAIQHLTQVRTVNPYTVPVQHGRTRTHLDTHVTMPVNVVSGPGFDYAAAHERERECAALEVAVGRIHHQVSVFDHAIAAQAPDVAHAEMHAMAAADHMADAYCDVQAGYEHRASANRTVRRGATSCASRDNRPPPAPSPSTSEMSCHHRPHRSGCPYPHRARHCCARRSPRAGPVGAPTTVCVRRLPLCGTLGVRGSTGGRLCQYLPL